MYVVPVSEEAELVLLPVSAADDVAALVARNRDRLAQWESWVTSPWSVQQSRAFLQTCLDEFAAGKRVGTYLRVDGRLAGWTGLSLRGHIGEVGYWLDAAYEGRGLASAAVRALLDIGFGQRALERIEIRTSPLNVRSRTLATRLGFRYEGTLRHAVARPATDGSDAFEDEVLYALVAQDWLTAPPGAAARQ